ncbi:hypothetical protein OROMI_009561 [Orobanche minor]
MEGRVSEEPQKVQTGITSCVCHGQIGEISKLYQKTLFIEEKHLSRVQSDLDDSGDKMGGHSEGPLFNLHFDMSGIARGENDPEVHICEVYPELLILDNELHPAHDAEFGILQVLFSNRAKLAVPGYEGVGLWCHVSFIAKPRNAGYIDDSPKHFFGELLFDRAKGKYDVTYCSIFDPRDPRNVGGCVFCPQDEVFLHPADGCPANGRGSGKTLAQKGTEASQDQAGGCSKLHSEKPYIFRNADDQDIITEAERDLDLKYAKIALEFYKKNKDAVFEIVEPLFSRCKPVPGSKCNEEWWCHVTFTAKPKSADCSDVALEHFFGELSRDSTTREYNATYCEIFKPTVRRITHGCLICQPLEKHPFDGFSAGRPPHSVAAKRLLKYLDEGVDSSEAKRNRVEKNDVWCKIELVPPHGPRVPPWMIYSTERVHEQNQVKESRRLWINSFNPAHFSTDRKYAEIAIKFYAKRKDVEYGILDVLFAYRKSLSLPKYEDVREWCHVSFIAKPKNKDGRRSTSLLKWWLIPFQGHVGSFAVVLSSLGVLNPEETCKLFEWAEPAYTERAREVIQEMKYKLEMKYKSRRLTHGCGFCREDRGNLHPADGYVAGLPSSTYPSHLSDDYLDAVESVRF